MYGAEFNARSLTCEIAVLNGWTVGVEVGFRYFMFKNTFLELTAKGAYGSLRGVPVYKGTANQEIWMLEEVMSVGFLF